MANIRAHLEQVLHLHESPHRTALAFAVGIFIAFSPTYGLHTISAVFCAWAFRLNAVALMTGAFVNNPWTVVPILAATFWTGFHVMGVPEGAPVQWSQLTLEGLYAQIQTYALPFFVGGILLSLLVTLFAYPVAYWVIAQARARRSAALVQESVATPNPPELR
nr:DUF2062 domain-containing protein [Nitrospirota bacterium]